MWLTRTAISRPVFILMLMVAAILLGSLAYQSMRKELNPDVEFGFISITTVYPGAGPEEMNDLVTRRIEDAVSGVAGLEEISSTSQEGVAITALRFGIGTNMDAALNEVRASIDTILRDLPSGTERPVVQKFNTTSEPIMTLVLNSPNLSNRELRDLADREIKDRFASIPGVAQVTITGGENREIQVQLRKDALVRYRIGIDEVLRAIQFANLNVPSGRLEEGDRESIVRVPADFATVQDIENLPIAKTDPNNPFAKPEIIRLGDVANVVDTIEERRLFTRLDGRDAVTVTIQKTREGNAIEISDRAKRVIAGIQRDFGINSQIVIDSSDQIRESLFDLNFALFFGIFLVALIIYVFLHNFRSTLIIAIAIPCSLLAAIATISLLGFTINSLSMLALSLAIGVLVDDAIVILENINRHLRMGEDPVTAAINGRSEIGLAAISISLADIVVFLPIGFLGGILGQFFKPLAFTYMAAVLFSLFVSFTVTPLLAARWFRKGEDMESAKDPLARGFEAIFKRFTNLYRGILVRALRHHVVVFFGSFVVLLGLFMFIAGSFAKEPAQAVLGTRVLVFAILALAVISFVARIVFQRRVRVATLVWGVIFALSLPLAALSGYGYRQWKGEEVFKFSFFPPLDSGQISIDVQLPPGSSLDATFAVVQQIEKVVSQHPDVRYVLSRVGSRLANFGFADTGTNLAGITVALHPKRAFLDRLGITSGEPGEKLRTRSNTAVAADLLQAVGRIPGADIAINAASGFGFGAPIQMSFTSTDRQLLVETVSTIRRRLAAGEVPGVITPDITSKPGKPEVRAVVDRTRLADAGITAAQVAQTMRILYEGDDTNRLRVGGQEFPIRVMMSPEDRNNSSIIEQIPISFNLGTPIFLGSVARVERATGVDKIDRRNRVEEVRLSAFLLSGYATGSVQRNIDQWLARENLVPEGVKAAPLGEAEFIQREGVKLFGALILGIVLVYMVLASLFDNLLYPFIVQLAQPQAFIGAILALILTDKTLNIVGFIGIIALAGLVGKNGILLVDFTNTLRKRGRSRWEAITEAAPIRLRPIMMTTLAIVFGLLPVALAIGRGSEFRETIGITIIGGMILSTFLTLIVIPCSYIVFDDLADRVARLRRIKREWDEPAPLEDASEEAREDRLEPPVEVSERPGKGG